MAEKLREGWQTLRGRRFGVITDVFPWAVYLLPVLLFFLLALALEFVMRWLGL